MSFANWLDKIRNAEKTSNINGRSRRISYKFVDGQEMVEEYSMDTGVVQRRAWKREKTLGGEPDWEIEMGDTIRSLNSQDKFVVRESVTEVRLKVTDKMCTRLK